MCTTKYGDRLLYWKNHVTCLFVNWIPNIKALSRGRWEIYRIGKDFMLEAIGIEDVRAMYRDKAMYRALKDRD